MNVSIMMTQQHNFPVSKMCLQRQSSYSSHQPKRSSQVKNRRLGPYTTTHPSAQIKALEMLNLGPSDVFFDLGCSDGRLVVMAMEAAIDKEAEEQRKLQGGKTSRGITWDHRLRCDERNEDCLMGECHHVKRRHSQSRENKDGVVNPPTLQYCYSVPAIAGDSLVDDSQQGRRRNHSFDSAALPHLMRNSSEDSFDDILDELSADGLDQVQLRQQSWHSAPTEIQHDDRSPITPLISNRKVLTKEGNPQSKEPPLAIETKEAARNGEQTEENAQFNYAELTTLQLPNMFDGSVEVGKFLLLFNSALRSPSSNTHGLFCV